MRNYSKFSDSESSLAILIPKNATHTAPASADTNSGIATPEKMRKDNWSTQGIAAIKATSSVKRVICFLCDSQKDPAMVSSAIGNKVKNATETM